MSVAIRGYIRGYWPLSVDFGDVSDVLKRTFVGPLVIVCHHASKKNAKVGYFFIMRLPAVIISRGMYVIN